LSFNILDIAALLALLLAVCNGEVCLLVISSAVAFTSWVIIDPIFQKNRED